MAGQSSKKKCSVNFPLRLAAAQNVRQACGHMNGVRREPENNLPGRLTTAAAKGENYWHEAGCCFQPIAVHRVVPGRRAAIQTQRGRIDDRSVELSPKQAA